MSLFSRSASQTLTVNSDLSILDHGNPTIVTNQPDLRDFLLHLGAGTEETDLNFKLVKAGTRAQRANDPSGFNLIAKLKPPTENSSPAITDAIITNPETIERVLTYLDVSTNPPDLALNVSKAAIEATRNGRIRDLSVLAEMYPSILTTKFNGRTLRQEAEQSRHGLHVVDAIDMMLATRPAAGGMGQRPPEASQS